MAEIDEGALVERALAGDSGAYGDLVNLHGKVVYNLLLRMVGNAEDARDLAQNVFVKAWTKLATFDRRNRFFSWIYRIALNEALNHRRRRRPVEELDPNLRSGSPGPEQCYEQENEAVHVRGALSRLREEDRQVLVMRHFLRLSHREMSDALHVPEKTVKSRLHTARVRLESELRRQGFGAS